MLNCVKVCASMFNCVKVCVCLIVLRFVNTCRCLILDHILTNIKSTGIFLLQQKRTEKKRKDSLVTWSQDIAYPKHSPETLSVLPPFSQRLNLKKHQKINNFIKPTSKILFMIFSVCFYKHNKMF